MTLILDPLNALIDHLGNGKAANYPNVKTIGIYAGQLSDALRGKNVVKMRDPVPAIYAILIDSSPVTLDPLHNIDLLIVTESRDFDKLEKHTDGLTICGGISKYLDVNKSFCYVGKPYLIDNDSLRVQTLAIDDRYSIFQITLQISEKL